MCRGPGGTGKTFLYNTLLAQVRSQSQINLGLARSGIAALLLSGGRTVHSRLKISIDIMSYLYLTFEAEWFGAAILAYKIFGVDEACLSNKHVAECVDRILRDMYSCDLPFGGKVFLLFNFRQILPVAKHKGLFLSEQVTSLALC